MPSSGVGAVVLNVTVTGAQASGNVTVYADGTAKPATSNLNYVKGQTVPNLVLAPVGADGKVALSVSGGTTHLVADVSAYELSGTPLIRGAVVPVTPARLLDTRIGLGAAKGAVTSGHTVSLQVAGKGGVPSSGVGAVVLNVTVTGAQASGNVTVYADGTAKPATSNLNYVKGQTVPNLVLAPVGADGKVALSVSGGTTHLVADISAYVRGADAQWGTTTAIDPTKGTPTGLSCPTAAFCAAVDAAGQALFFHGQSWSSPAPVDGQGGLTDVSCSSSTACVAVDSQGDATVWNGSTWSARTEVLGVSGPNGHVSCVPATFVCVATAGHVVATFNGSTWSPTTTLDTGAGSLTSVSCPSPSFCAVGSSAGTVTTDTGGVWSDPSTVFADQLGPSVDVSCSSASFCAAVDTDLASTYTASAWSTPVAVTATNKALLGLSCPADGECTAVDNTGQEFTLSAGAWTGGPTVQVDAPLFLACPAVGSCLALDSAGYAVPYSHGAWGTPVAADIASGTLNAVSCSSAGFCLAVDSHGNDLTFDGATWSAPVPIARHVAPIALSCVGDRFCAMSGASGAVGTYTNGQWTLATIPVDGDEFDTVSCSSASFCVAVDSSGYATTWNGTSWSAPVNAMHISPAGSNSAQSVSCPVDGTCYVDNVSGGVWTLIAGQWSGAVSGTQTQTGALSCWAVGECRMSASGGGFAVMHGGVWAPSLTRSTFPAGGPIGSLDCRTASFCGGAGGPGSDFVSEFDGQIWQPIDEITGMPNTPVSISCPTSALCVGVAGDSARTWHS